VFAHAAWGAPRLNVQPKPGGGFGARLRRMNLQVDRPSPLPQRLGGSGPLEEYPNLPAYNARGEARPACKRAFEDQLAVLTRNPSPAR